MGHFTAIPGIVAVGIGALAASGLAAGASGSGDRLAAARETVPRDTVPGETVPSGTVSNGAGSNGAGSIAVGPRGVVPPPMIVPPLKWTRCKGLPRPAPGTRAPRGGFRCATLDVPLDYARQSAEKIGIALVKAPAADQRRQLGSLLFNFGGPGGDGVDTLAQVAGEYADLGARYDLVGFDPRGVGRSAPVRCAGSRTLDDLFARDDSPDTPAEEKAYADGRAAFTRGCATHSGRLLPHVGTVNAARDMDLIRAALGEERLNYFGISYGTWLGGNYAHQFPGRVGRAVLDGAVDTGLRSADLALQQAAGFEHALRDFGAACARLGPKDCPLGADGPSVVASTRRILAGLDAKPLRTSGRRRHLTQSLGTAGVAAGLYSKEAWPYLAQGLVDAVKRRDGSLLLMLADVQNGRRENGAYTGLTSANTAITCADGTDRYTPADVRRLLPRFRAAAPVFGASAAWGLLQCTGWPVRGDDAAREVAAPAAAPILVVGNTGDPATPYAWAAALTRRLGGRATLLTLRGEGHGAYDTGDPCVRRNVHAYLLQGTVPAAGTTCG
ncbi:alpha/beta hydrolase [Actinomadura syzygii]|uniref:Alpha/beta hydrolase n=1 Tax=Actinomadura syzygii TaxID=1427538 RepID=A0A5D0U119_9ACTN|nr:alpha/beta hydrolase [Actinomadura syzygii]